MNCFKALEIARKFEKIVFNYEIFLRSCFLYLYKIVFSTNWITNTLLNDIYL